MNEYERKMNGPAMTDLSTVTLVSPLQMIGTQVGNRWTRQMALGLPNYLVRSATLGKQLLGIPIFARFLPGSFILWVTLRLSF